MEAKVVTGHAKAKPAHHKGHKATHMRIERAENGVMVHTEHEKAPMSKSQMRAGVMDNGYQQPEKYMFNDKQALMDHIAEKFGDVLGGKGKPAASAAAADGKSDGPETEEDTDSMS